MKYNFIAIEGNIGSGKTSLAEKAARDLNARLCLENFADNPFLPKFYSKPQQFAFPLEMFFMAERFQQMKHIFSQRDLFKDIVVSDYLFAKSQLFASINLDGDESLLYKRLFGIMYPNLPQPQLIVYLHNDVSNLLLNIARRGREYEKSITADYLEKIQFAYFQYFKTLSRHIVLIVNVSKLNFVYDKYDYHRLLDVMKHDYTSGMHFINP
ncbi:MAG TPA: deoxynucleoside kinase [Chitinophagales bacterium]|nr:deoxynucleoside kinase [Chitinophagales bacterium]